MENWVFSLFIKGVIGVRRKGTDCFCLARSLISLFLPVYAFLNGNCRKSVLVYFII